MTIFKKLQLLSIVLIILCDKIYTQDITEDRKYGCTWSGGSAARVSCNCEKWAELTLKSDSINTFSTSEVLISGCKTVRVEPNAISDMRSLRLLSLSNIGSIYFEERSINWYGYRENVGQIEEERFDLTVPSLKINIYNSYISQISSHAFSGRISDITFDRVHIEVIQPLAFVNLLQTEKITIRNSVLEDIGVQAFKKFSTEFFELSNVTADLVPSRSISNITVYEVVTIQNCTFNTIRSGGLTIYNPRVFQGLNNNFSHVNGEAFKIISRGRIIFRNNRFGIVDNGAFRGISLRRDILLDEPLITFDSNILSSINSASLSMSEGNIQFRNVYVEHLCDCTDIDETMKDSSYYEEIYCQFSNDYMTVKYFTVQMCSGYSNYYIILIVVCVVSVLLIVIVSALLLYYKFVYKTRKYGKDSAKNKNLSLIVPDGRTYRETELHVIVERTDLLTTDL